MNSSIDKIIAETPIFEDSKTLELFEYFDSIKEQGFLTKEQGLRILKWKSPRPLKHYKKNSNEDFKKITNTYTNRFGWCKISFSFCNLNVFKPRLSCS